MVSSLRGRNGKECLPPPLGYSLQGIKLIGQLGASIVQALVHLSQGKTMPNSPYSPDCFSSLRSETLWVSPEMATHFRTSCHFERQRPINRDHVRRLASEMRQGWFLQGTPIWFCVYTDGSMVIVNGNHTLEAVAESGIRIPLTFIYQRVSSLDEVAKSYACFDIQNQRTWSQTAVALGVADEVPLIKQVMPAIGVILQEFKGGYHFPEITKSRQLRFNTVAEYKPAILQFADAIAGAPKMPKRQVTKAAVMAVALATFRYQPSAAAEFWHETAMDDGLKGNDPRKTLLRYLENNPAQNSNMNEQLCKATALAWNSCWAQRALGLLKPGSMKEFRLLGTPWHQGVEAKTEAYSKNQFIVATDTGPSIETGIKICADGSVKKITMMRK